MICYGSRDVAIAIWNLISLRRHIALSHVIYICILLLLGV